MTQIETLRREAQEASEALRRSEAASARSRAQLQSALSATSEAAEIAISSIEGSDVAQGAETAACEVDANGMAANSKKHHVGMKLTSMLLRTYKEVRTASTLL